jgi:hypothetical protein
MYLLFGKFVQELSFCCGGTHITEWSACFFRYFLMTILEMEVSLPGHKVRQTPCHQSSFLWVFMKNIVRQETVQNAVGIEMHYKCSYTVYCWTCWTSLSRRLHGILMPAKQQNVNTWSCAKYGCELGKVSDHTNQWWSGFVFIISFYFKVCKYVHHHTFQINQPTRCNNLLSLLLDVYVQLNMFRACSRPSSGAQQLQ